MILIFWQVVQFLTFGRIFQRSKYDFSCGVCQRASLVSKEEFAQEAQQKTAELRSKQIAQKVLVKCRSHVRVLGLLSDLAFPGVVLRRKS